MSISMSYPSRLPAAESTRLDPHAHIVQFYGADDFLLDEVSRFIGSALGAGDAGIVIATRAHRDEIIRRLKVRGLDIALASRQGRFVSLDAAETLAKFMQDDMPDAARFADLMGGVIARATEMVGGESPRVAAFGEMVSLLCAEGKADAAVRLEELWNDLANTYSFDLHCAYPLSLFGQSGDGASFAHICAAHSHVIPAESYTLLGDEEERLRAITLLQQKAQALESEIVERRKVQQVLRERNHELHEAVVARDEFLSVAAHELKTPLTVLRAFAQLLVRDLQRKGDITPERLEAALGAIELQTGKLAHLVTRLLDTSQIEAGKLCIEPSKTDLVALIRTALAQQHGTASHAFVFDGPEHLEAQVDPIRFEQVITNLLDNAVKFSPQGGTVTVGLWQDGIGSHLSVTDQGVGISPEEREAVFDRFHQGHSNRHLSGMGLGLYITREIVDLHGGYLRYEDPGHPGSRFVITLPQPPVSLN